MVRMKTSERGKYDRQSSILYTFNYASKTATDPVPLVIPVVGNSRRRIWKASNNKTYMSGINIGSLSPWIQAYTIKKLKERVEMGRKITYRLISVLNKTLKIYYRNYRWVKVQNLHAIDTDIYLELATPEEHMSDNPDVQLNAQISGRDIFLNYLNRQIESRLTFTRNT